jgi:hypothetical protein
LYCPLAQYIPMARLGLPAIMVGNISPIIPMNGMN